jgi:hypothetical protein
MPGLIDTDIGGNGFTREQWKEKIAGFMPGGGDVFSLDQSECVVQGIIPWDVRYSFILTVLGYAEVEGYSLTRGVPLEHPWFPWMTAHSVAIHPYQPNSESATTLKQEADRPEYAFDQAGYNYAQATIRFKNTPYETWDDDFIDTYEDGLAEWQRFCYDATREGSLEIISQTGRKMIFAEGTVGYPKGAELPTEIGTYAYKEVINFRWMFVPREYVCGADEENLVLKKIAPCVGKLNETEFLGCEKGTLLLNPPHVERFEWPLRKSASEDYGMSEGSAYGFHITFPFQYFDPPTGVSPQVYYGHNLLPWGGITTDGTAADPATYGQYIGKWFYATNDGTTVGANSLPLLPYAEFRSMFTAADAP